MGLSAHPGRRALKSFQPSQFCLCYNQKEKAVYSKCCRNIKSPVSLKGHNSIESYENFRRSYIPVSMRQQRTRCTGVVGVSSGKKTLLKLAGAR